MRKVASLAATFLVGIMSVLTGQAGSPVPLQYHGGPFLEKFEVFPLYYGAWTEAEIDAQQAYVVNLAAYMSGKNAPEFSQPMTKQYGVDHVTVAAAQTASANPSSGVLSQDDVLKIIAANQASGKLPAFGPDRLIILFPGAGLTASGGGSVCGNAGGCHGSQSTSAFWAVVPQAQEQVVIAHEIFEAATDPAINNFAGWDEAVDQCDNAPNISLPAFGKTFQIPPTTDNTQNGACSTSGYTSLAEAQDYGATHTEFVNDYHTRYNQGFRLYILQSYVLADGSTFGDVRYNAVWRPGNVNEQLLIELTNEQIVSQLNTLNSQGWRLYILQSYVLANGTVAYNAVLRAGTVMEHGTLGETFTQLTIDNVINYQKDYRPYILQPYVTSSGDVSYNTDWRPGDLAQVIQPQATFADFESTNDTEDSQGFRLYIFQSYVKASGEVLHSAVWRPGTHEEKTFFGSTYADYKAKYDEIYPLGWRLYILNAYVLPNGDVRYDAVWRLGTIDRPL